MLSDSKKNGGEISNRASMFQVVFGSSIYLESYILVLVDHDIYAMLAANGNCDVLKMPCTIHYLFPGGANVFRNIRRNVPLLD